MLSFWDAGIPSHPSLLTVMLVLDRDYGKLRPSPLIVPFAEGRGASVGDAARGEDGTAGEETGSYAF